jgi:hypothetical protein
VVNNTFTEPWSRTDRDTTINDYWYGEPPRVLDRLDYESGDKIFWINIVSEYEEHSEPMTIHDAVHLDVVQSDAPPSPDLKGDWLPGVLGNQYEFKFRDKFRVDIYEIAGTNVTRIDSYAPGVIDQIEIRGVGGEPEDGEVQDPPWTSFNP